MKPYALSLAVGLLVGVVYALFQVRSPAPPVVALVGLLGILLGEQIPPLLRQALQKEAPAVSWLQQQVRPHMFGELPQCRRAPATPAVADAADAALQEKNRHG